MKNLLIIISILISSSCINENELKPVFPTSFIHDDNSKLWQVEESGKYWPRKPFNRVVFFQDGTCYFHRKSNFSELQSIKGKFDINVNDRDTVLLIKSINPPLAYDIKSFTKNKIVLVDKFKTKKDPSNDESIILVPYKKPY